MAERYVLPWQAVFAVDTVEPSVAAAAAPMRPARETHEAPPAAAAPEWTPSSIAWDPHTMARAQKRRALGAPPEAPRARAMRC